MKNRRSISPRAACPERTENIRPADRAATPFGASAKKKDVAAPARDALVHFVHKGVNL
jgi:hypothetical protein